MKRTALRILAIAAVLGTVGALTSHPAEAHSRSRSHFFFGFNFGTPCCTWSRPHYYAPHYYAPRYYYYNPPPVVYVPPPPVYYAPPRVVAPAPVCRDYHGDATVDANGTPFYGRACLQSDGRWHIVSTY